MDQEPLTFLEKSHCVPILLALYRNGMMNRNQLYQELGETINIVIKRIELLKQNELIREFKMDVKPFAKYLALTEKGRDVACNLDSIEKAVTCPGKEAVLRVNYPFEIEDEDTAKIAVKYQNSPVYLRERDEIRKEVAHLHCEKCSGPTYLIKDKSNFYWICFKCGIKSVADIEDAKTLLLQEKYY